MVLVDTEINERIDSAQLLKNHDPKSVQNCRYDLRAGRAFAPETGDEISLTRHKWKVLGERAYWKIEPSETLMIMTCEEVKMPADLMGSYGALNHLARKGLLLINASIVEPGYEGYLSCFLVNFSSETAYIMRGDPVAKMCFYELKNVPSQLKTVVDTVPYWKSLSKAAAKFPASFLNIGGIEKRIIKKTQASAKSTIILGGIVIGLLVTFATLEPLFSKWIYDRTGLSTNSTTLETTKLTQELKDAAIELKNAAATVPRAAAEESLKNKNEALQTEIDSLKERVRQLAAKVK